MHQKINFTTEVKAMYLENIVKTMKKLKTQINGSITVLMDRKKYH